ncbi:hypothetical protein [Longimicrobium sp.]|uniref:YfcC family protein n=1 Tax=Longimicrobium sp. TaxID=2029185 RepID=UPI002BDA0332|nr:hypothetical protein [Longimicrobium sp.]HSU14642.1 hypothetical protein [Longimicrobium sp.]
MAQAQPSGTLLSRIARVRFPHPLILLVGGVLLAALLTWVLPAGEYGRTHDPVTGRDVVVAGTYHTVAPQPVGPFDAVVSIPQGMIEAADVIFFVFLVGGAFAVVEKTGALTRGMDALLRVLRGREALVIPVVSLAFATGGALEHMQEEIIALVPALLLLTRRLGYQPMVAVAMSIGAAVVGAAFGPIDPFQVGIAQKLAHIPVLSGTGFRMAFMLPALAIWIWGTMRYANRTRTEPEAAGEEAGSAAGGRSIAILLLILATFVVFVYGVFALGWDFSQMAAIFFVMGVLAGIVGGLGVGGTAESFVDGFRAMAYAGLLIGFARAITVVLEHGKVVDTVVNALFTPLAHVPVLASAGGMMLVHTLVHFPVPSASGQAVLTMPVLVPLADLLGMARQVVVLAYQYGAGMCEMVTPTNGALMAILAATGVPYEKWMKMILPLWAALFALGFIAVAVAIATGLR